MSRFRDYFTGHVSALTGLGIDAGDTDFQRTVGRVVGEIPAGSTLTYREVGERIGATTSVRAVATSIGANPIAIAIPYHQVVRADREPGAHGSARRKRWLLNHEIMGSQ